MKEEASGVWQFALALIANPALWGFLGVVAGAALAWLKESSTFRREQRQDLQFSAAQISSALHRFMTQCSDVASDHGSVSLGGVRIPSCNPPTPPDLSTLDLKWRILPASVLDDLFALPNEMADAQKKLERHNDDPPYYTEFFIRRRLQYANIGLDAHDIDVRLRRAAKLPKRDSSAVALVLTTQLIGAENDLAQHQKLMREANFPPPSSEAD